MTENEFKSELVKLSPKLSGVLGNPTGGGRELAFGDIAKAFTNTSEPDAALAVLKEDRTKLSSFEALVASIARAAASEPVSSQRPVLAQSPQQTRAEIQAQLAYMWVGPVLSFAVLVGFFTMLYCLLNGKTSELKDLGGVQNVLFTLLGALGAAFTQVINYWLGSSKGSSDKTLLIGSSIGPRS